MNILFVVPYVPTLVRVRPYNLIRYLSDLGHQVTVFTITTNESDRYDVDAFKKYCHHIEAIHLPRWRSLINCIASLPRKTPLQTSYCWDTSLARKIENLLGIQDCNSAFDIAHIEHLRGVRYALRINSSNPRIPVIWDSVDCISLLFKQAASNSSRRLNRWITRLELPRTKYYEAQLTNEFDQILVTSLSDKEAFISLCQSQPSTPITILPNGVDLKYFRPAPSVQRESNTLVVTGKMSYHANISMVLYLVNNILPYIWAKIPGANLWIVGKDPPRMIRDLSNESRITVTGTVDDIRPYLLRASAALSPLTYGAGIQNKVLEAMSCGTPVVSSSKAIAALDTINGRDVLISDDPYRFAELVVQLLGDKDSCRQLGLAGREYVETHHEWEKIAKRLENIYNENIITKTNSQRTRHKIHTVC